MSKKPRTGVILICFFAFPLWLQSQVLMIQQQNCQPGDSIVALVYPLPDRNSPLSATYPDGSVLEIPGVPYPVQSLGKGYLALIPIPPDCKPGTVQVSWQNQQQQLSVKERSFTYLNIPLSEAPLPAAAGDNRLYRQLARFNEDQKYWSGAPFQFPMSSYKTISSPYGQRRTFSRGGHSWNEIHQGIDYAQDRGTPVYAPSDGRVVISEFLDSPGNLVVVEFFPGMYQLFYHLDSRSVNRGDQITRGTLIGHVGTTGKSTGPHLHFEVRLHAIFVDPQPYLDGDFNLQQILPSMVNQHLTGLLP